MGGQLSQIKPGYGQATPQQFQQGAQFSRPMYTGAMMRPEYNLQAMNPEIASAMQTMMSRATPYRVNVPMQNVPPQAPMGAARFLTGTLPYETNFGVPQVNYQVPQFQAGNYEDFMTRYDQEVANYLAQQEANRLAAEQAAAEQVAPTE